VRAKGLAKPGLRAASAMAQDAPSMLTDALHEA